MTADAERPSPWSRAGIPLLIIATGLCAYANSFSTPFLFDDQQFIVDNPAIRRLWPPWDLIRGSTRPLTDVTFALNYALGSLRVWGYHLVNLIIHLAAGLTLCGLVRRTLLGERLRGRYGGSAHGLALASALIWVAHPLHTESVTYLVQRAESLMGLCYLFSLYAAVRGSGSGRPHAWYAAAIVSCALGMASKAVMATAPLIIVLYDRVFLSPTINDALQKRRALYLGLAATWGLLAILLVHPSNLESTSVGFGMAHIGPLDYLASQPGVLTHYLRMSVWPRPLVLDYSDWPVAKTFAALMPQALLIGGLLVTVGWAIRRRPGWGFLGAWFFIILAPTSLVPLKDLVFEHRLYVPLAGVVVLVVLAAWHLLRGLVVDPRVRAPLASGLVCVAVGLLAAATIRRNADYRSERIMWRDVVAKRPVNPRARNNLGKALAEEGRFDEAIGHYAEALRLKPDYAMAHNNLGNALAEQGRLEDAWTHLTEALRLEPGLAEAYNNLGNVLRRQGKVDEAVAQYAEALRRHPGFAETRINLGVALKQQGRLEEAIAQYEEALRLNPDLAPGHNNLGNALRLQGRLEEAVLHLTEALRLRPGSADGHNNLGVVLAQLGRGQEAMGHYAEALRLKPDFAEAHNNLGVALEQAGRLEDAQAAYAAAVRTNPAFAQGYNNLGALLARQGRLHEAITQYAKALRINPAFAEARENLRRALARLKAPEAGDQQ